MNGNRKGPEEKGSKTGRGFGYCNGFDKAGCENPVNDNTRNQGMGRGRRMSKGRGMARGNGFAQGRGFGRRVLGHGNYRRYQSDAESDNISELKKEND